MEEAGRETPAMMHSWTCSSWCFWNAVQSPDLVGDEENEHTQCTRGGSLLGGQGLKRPRIHVVGFHGGLPFSIVSAQRLHPTYTRQHLCTAAFSGFESIHVKGEEEEGRRQEPRGVGSAPFSLSGGLRTRHSLPVVEAALTRVGQKGMLPPCGHCPKQQ